MMKNNNTNYVKPGDLVKYRGSWYKLRRVNPKSVTIEGWMGIPDWTYLADYSYISEVKRLNENPRDVIGDPPNSIMRMQLSKLWKGDAEACRTACEDCGIEEICAPAKTRPAVTWRNFLDHKSETKAVKEALKKAGIEAEVKHGSGTAWGWLEINIGDPGMRNGLRQGPFGNQYTDEERVLHDTVLKIAKEVTGRHGDYNGEILVLAQGWRTELWLGS